MTPVEASDIKNLEIVNKRINRETGNIKKVKFKVGDRVRIYRWKKDFEKGSTERWTYEIFVADSINKSSIPLYII